ncbi:MAG: DUF3090 family protein, partial [Chloroflexi bacterium]|nr:DUF3090 family protein [Chloroflexota bacterium]
VPVHVEFKTGEMSLRHDPASDVFTLVASDIPREDSADGPLAQITINFRREQAKQIADLSVEIVAAGRKPCPLCEAPLTPGKSHFCVKVNGYNPVDDPMGTDRS